MTDPWVSLLNGLPLSRTERAVVKRYEGEPHGRAFLPVADILRSHKLVDEALEMLTQGVERHPSFTVARVVLARELLMKGMIADAWRTLEESAVSLKDNVLAQKIRFKLAILLEMEEVVRATFQHLHVNQMLDGETKALADAVALSGLPKAKEKLVGDLEKRGADIIIPIVRPSDSQRSAAGPGAHGHPAFEDEATDEPADADDAMAGFHVVPLDEIFEPSDSAEVVRAAPGGVELDSTTLADIYARQGHYAKALSVFRRLLRLSPNSDLLRRKVGEMARLEKEQRTSDLSVDPAIVDRMEAIEIIDRQIRFYNELLEKLT